jgi:EAL domain-containing protein (putative c-di-GMP-specific phosphodiesterase class I)/ActR/RegA family two-component response regulator
LGRTTIRRQPKASMGKRSDAKSSATISVLIADDEPMVRTFLTELLNDSLQFEVVASAGSAEEAIALAGRVQPALALLDVKMPGGGAEATRGILDCSPNTQILALSGYDDDTTALEMIRAGAVSYIVKGAPPEEIVETAIRSAHGESVLSPEISSGVISQLAAHLKATDHAETAERHLRERVQLTIDERLFDTVFQPIVRLEDNRIIGYEALSRFRSVHLHRPDLWFADAERVGLRVALELVTAHAAAEQYEAAEVDQFLSLNMSPETLGECADLISGFGGERLVIEITEHSAIADYDALQPMLQTLRQLGVRIAVDDAGAGFSSLRHALQLEPDYIKLDVSLTQSIDSDRKRRALAAGMIGFANELGAKIVAEGIEAEAELQTLLELGVPLGQGFLVGRPEPLPPILSAA